VGYLGPTWFQGEEQAPEGTVFHYTNRVALRGILAAGVIRPHKAMPSDRVPLVWASTCGIWEPAAGRGQPWSPAQPLSFDAMAQLHGGLARIVLDESAVPLGWAQLKALCSPQWLALLQGEGGAWVRQHAHRWRGSTHAVSRESWLGIQTWRAPRWRDMPYSWEVLP
jgi:hypothetical protein